MSNDDTRDNDWPRTNATDGDSIRNVTWTDHTTYSLPLPEEHARFIQAGIDRTLRTLQLYCEQGHLRAAKYPTETGSVWYVDPDSVETKIEEIRQVQETLHRPATTTTDVPRKAGYDGPRPDAERRDVSPNKNTSDKHDASSTSADDKQRQPNDDVGSRSENTDYRGTRQDATDHDSGYVSVPVRVLDALTNQLAAKDAQLERQDAQLARLVQAHDHDRQLLGAALSLIHNEDFNVALQPEQASASDAPVAPPVTADQVQPEFPRAGGKPPEAPNPSGV